MTHEHSFNIKVNMTWKKKLLGNPNLLPAICPLLRHLSSGLLEHFSQRSEPSTSTV